MNVVDLGWALSDVGLMARITAGFYGIIGDWPLLPNGVPVYDYPSAPGQVAPFLGWFFFTRTVPHFPYGFTVEND